MTCVYCLALATLTSEVTDEDARAHSSSKMGAPLEVEARIRAVAEAARDRKWTRMLVPLGTEDLENCVATESGDDFLDAFYVECCLEKMAQEGST